MGPELASVMRIRSGYSYKCDLVFNCHGNVLPHCVEIRYWSHGTSVLQFGMERESAFERGTSGDQEASHLQHIGQAANTG